MTGRADLFDLIGMASPISQAVLFLLLTFSVFSWAVILYKFRLFRSIRSQDRRFLAAFESLDDPKEIRRRAAAITKSPMADLFVETYRRVLSNEESAAMTDAEPRESEASRHLERILRQMSDRQLMQEEEYLAALATVGNVSPFVGLFGTVLGIIQAFQEIGRQGTASIAAVAPGLAEALVATAAGLFAAIPAVVAYNYFLNQTRRHATQLDVFRQDLLALAEGRRTAEPVVLGRPSRR